MMLTQCLFLSKAQRLRPLLSIRQISSSKDSQKAAAVAQEEIAPIKKGPSSWISYGFDRRDEKMDRRVLHMSLFGGVTLCLVLVGYGIMYAPDVNYKHWAQREAFIELRRREAAGLPSIDPNLVNPTNVILPEESELNNTEIIV